MNNEMEMLLADTHEVKINGRNIVIKKFPMLAGIRLTSKISNVVSKVVSGDEKTENFNTAINALFVNENMWDIVKKYKNPTVHFSLLCTLVTNKTKAVMKDFLSERGIKLPF